MHCCLALRALSLPHKPPLHHHCHVPLRANPSPTWNLPTLLYLLLRPPALTQKEAVLPGSLVKWNAAGTWTSLTLLSDNIHRHHVHRGFWKCGSPSPEVKNTHFTTEPDCVLSVFIFMEITLYFRSIFFVLFYVSLPLTLSIAKKKNV